MTKKIIKIILISLAVVSIGIGVTITLLVTTINQDTIKNKVTELVHEQTGRDLKIAGDISWTVFPWLGIKIHDISLSNPPDFKDSNFAQAKELSISVKLLPLIFERSIEANNLALKDLDLHLITDNLGKSNWQDLLALTNTPKQPTVAEDKTHNLNKFIIGNITINNGNIFWQDQENGQKFKISNLDLFCKNINFKRPFTVKTSFNLSNLNNFLDGDIDVKTQISLDTDNVYKFKDLKLLTANAIVTGSLQVTKTTDIPDFSGTLTISDTGPKALTQLLGIQSQKQLNSSFKAVAELSPQIIKILNIKATLDEMVLEGNANYSANTLAFDISLNKLDPNIFNTEPNKTKTSTSTTTKEQTTTQSNSKFLQTIKTNGDLKIGEIRSDKLNLANFTTKIVGNNGVFDCQKLSFDFYQSRFFGNATIDLRNPIMQSNLRLSVESTPLRALLIDLAKYDKFSGNLTLNTNINVRGQTTKEMFNSLSGTGNVLITNGSYHGIDIPYEVRRIHAMLNVKPLPQKSDPPHTDFNQLTMSFNMRNALLNTNDLLIQAPDYEITGKGSANLSSEHLDLALNACSIHDKNFFLPVKITGAFNNPSVRIDAAVMLQHKVEKAILNIIQGPVKVEKNLLQDFKKILPIDKLLH